MEVDLHLPNEEILKLIEENNISELRFEGEPLFTGLFECSKTNIIKLLLERGKINIDDRDSADGTPLHWSCFRGDMENTKLLLDMGADINQKDKDGHTPLHYSCYTDNEEMITFLLDIGVKFHFTPRHFEKPKVFQNGADVNAKSVFGETPLFRLTMNNLNIMKLLVDRGERNLSPHRFEKPKVFQNGAIINGKNDLEISIFDRACQDKRLDVIEFLFQNGMKIDYENDIPTWIDDETLKLIESYKGKNIKGVKK